MRCKVGDLAVIVRSNRGFEGCLAQVVGPIEKYDVTGDWRIEIFGHPSPHSSRQWTATDSHLRPIRPDEGTDETLLWAGLPKETVNA